MEARRPIVSRILRRSVRTMTAAAHLLVFGWLALSGTAAPADNAGKPKLGDAPDGSRARPVHIIPLRDAEGAVIRPGDRPLLPFSTRQTCGADCHDVQKIGHGWHFN